MSNKPKYIGTRVHDELHDRIKHRAESQGISVSDFLRSSVEQALDIDSTPDFELESVDALRDLIQVQKEQIEFLRQELSATQESKNNHLSEKDQQISSLQEELTTKNQQIDQLHQLVAMEQKNLGEMTQQLAQSQNQLEDLRKPRPWWQRWKRK